MKLSFVTVARLFAALALFACGAAQAADVRVMISAGFYHAYHEMSPAFEKASGQKLVTIRGPSLGDSPEAIPNRLKRGEPVDVVIMVGASIDNLMGQGLVRPGSKVDLARSQIGMVVRTGAAKPDIGSVDAFKQALLGAKSVAYSDSASGIYLSTTLFEKLGVAAQVMPKSRKIKGPPSGEPVAAVVARGDAEIGFQQVSELLNVPGVTFVGPIPASLQQDTFFSAGVGAKVSNADGAAALMKFLASSEAAPYMTKAGLGPLAK
ncbi:MAG: ABC transporter substrate-binding protein [Betaproteobacteria bacterium]|nr:ABC transporter substrate-binding protein [Betaproteobacteria bacterium]